MVTRKTIDLLGVALPRQTITSGQSPHAFGTDSVRKVQATPVSASLALEASLYETSKAIYGLGFAPALAVMSWRRHFD